MISREAFEASLPKVYEHDAKTFSIKKRKRAHISGDVRTMEELKNKRKKKGAISEDIIEVKLNRSKRRKKHKERLFSNADIRKTIVAPNVKVTNKMKKQKKELRKKGRTKKF